MKKAMLALLLSACGGTPQFESQPALDFGRNVDAGAQACEQFASGQWDAAIAPTHDECVVYCALAEAGPGCVP